jgi:succinoglycan biosynthesis transport protein ExoP
LEAQRNQPADWVIALRRRWLLLLAGLLVGAGLGALAAALSEDEYEASALFSIVGVEGGQVDDGYAEVYSRLAIRPDVTGSQLRTAGFPELADDPEDAITVRAAPDAPTFELSALADDAEEAAAIANAAADGVVEYTDETSDRIGAQVELLARASPPADPSTLSFSLAIGAGAALGLTIAILIALSRRPPQ